MEMKIKSPYPHPGLLRAYEDVYEGAAKEIFEYTRKNQDHAIWMDREGGKTTKLHLRITFIFGVLGQMGTTAIALSGFAWAYFRPDLAKEGFVFSAFITGYLIWWKTKQKQNK